MRGPCGALHGGQALRQRVLAAQSGLQRRGLRRILPVGSSQQVQRGGRCGCALGFVQHVCRRSQCLHQRLHRRAQRRAARLGRDKADIQRLRRRRQSAVKEHLFQQRAVFIAAGHLHAALHQQIPVRVGEQAARAQQLWKLALAHTQHKAYVRAVQTHAVRSGHDDRVLRFGNMAQVRFVQQQREQLGVFRCRHLVPAQKLLHLAQQIHHVFPSGVQCAGAQRVARLLKRGGRLCGVLRAAESIQQQIQLLGDARCRLSPRRVQKAFHTGHNSRAQSLRPGQSRPILIRHLRAEARRILFKRGAPVGRFQLPGVSVIFQNRDFLRRKPAQVGFEQAQERLGGKPFRQQRQRRRKKSGPRSVLGAGGLVCEIGDAC